jgi:hypothetical protein
MRETWQRWNKWKPPLPRPPSFLFSRISYTKKERLVKYIDDRWKPISTGRILVPLLAWCGLTLCKSHNFPTKSIKTHLATEQTSSGLGKTTKKGQKFNFRISEKLKKKKKFFPTFSVHIRRPHAHMELFYTSPFSHIHRTGEGKNIT